MEIKIGPMIAAEIGIRIGTGIGIGYKKRPVALSLAARVLERSGKGGYALVHPSTASNYRQYCRGWCENSVHNARSDRQQYSSLQMKPQSCP